MTINKQSDWTAIDVSLYRPGRVIQYADVRDLWLRETALFQEVGARTVGQVFDPFFETTSTSYTQANEASGEYSLNNWMGILTPERLVGKSGNQYEITCLVFGRNVDVRFTFLRFDTTGTTNIGALIVTPTQVTLDDYVFHIEAITIGQDVCSIDGDRANGTAALGIYAEAKINGTGQSPGEVAYVIAYENFRVREDGAGASAVFPQADPAIVAPPYSSGYSSGYE